MAFLSSPHKTFVIRHLTVAGWFILILLAVFELALAAPQPAQARGLSASLPQSELKAAASITQTAGETTEIFNRIYLPVIDRAQLPQPPEPDPTPYKIMFCSSGSIDIPDDNPTGAVSEITVNDGGYLLDMQVYVDVRHPWMGDVEVELSHTVSGKHTTLIERPGYPADSDGCNFANARVILDDKANQTIENQCEAANLAASGSFLPIDLLQEHYADSAEGTWSLKAIDAFPNDTGRINRWCLDLTLSASQPGPYTAPEVIDVPDSARISNITAGPQSMPLDCEIRSAVDWARYFGTPVDEYEFFDALPASDNPELGFVGNVYGAWGQTPPEAYGVHAEPIAKQLRDYGVEAQAQHRTSWNQVQTELAAGRPVIAWIIGNYYGYYLNKTFPIYYYGQDGSYTVVAPYEHSVLVVGYSQTNVYILDQGNLYTPSLDEFLDTWAVLGNMAVLATP